MEDDFQRATLIQYDFFLRDTYFIIYCTDQYRSALKSQEVNADYLGESVMYLTKS